MEERDRSCRQLVGSSLILTSMLPPLRTSLTSVSSLVRLSPEERREETVRFVSDVCRSDRFPAAHLRFTSCPSPSSRLTVVPSLLRHSPDGR